MINITAKNFELTEGIKENIENKFSKFKKFISPGKKIDVVLDSNKYGQQIEVFVTVKNKIFKADSINEDLYVSIDLVVDKIDKQIRRYIDKISKNDKDSIRFAEIKVNLENSEDFTPKITRRKFISSKPMFEAEAIEQMELLEHKSFIFFNADTDSPCMLYKRFDGHYGIIEVE